MPEGSRRGSQRSPSTTAAKRPSSLSSLSGIVGRMMSSGERGASSSSCTSVNTVCSEGERPASLSLSSSASSASLQDASSSSSSSSSSLPYGAVPAYGASSSAAQRNGSDISLELTPLVPPRGGGVVPGGGACVAVAPATAPAPPRQLSRLERVVMEIVETEQAYVRDLKSIVEDYLGCIIDCGALPLRPEQVSSLFCNIEDIYEFNSDLLEDLERSPHAADIAGCFVERSEAFNIYTLYCMNYPNSVAVLRECMQDESLVRFFQERQATLNHSLPLETYLLKPVQRILKYHLLLQELSKHFDKSTAGYEVVEDAVITMTAVAWYINDMKRKQEHAVRLQEIESLLVNWSGPDLGGFGELVLEGSFKVQRVKKERAFFLFDKMLLIAKKRLEHFVYSTHIFCCNLLLVETLKDPLCFRVTDQTIPKQQHVVQTKNQEEKRLWVHYLKRLIVENHLASLPQKARQVLGDTFCQSPHFQESSASSRRDDIHGHHRGRRQSEPPELLMYTPEKSRKGLPLLLDGNLPSRRSRRQSAPAKDIEAAFHPNALKPSGSDGELDSAGSSCTLASSVIEVEAESRPKREAEEEEEEELSPLIPPPTLSITEEILEFINQSRAREGLTSIHSDATEQILDQTAESPPPPCQTNFTCPLPPLTSSSGPEQDREEEEDEEVEGLQSQTSGPGEENGLEDETKTNRDEEVPEAAREVEVEACEEERREEETPKEEEKRERSEEGAAPTSDLLPFISAGLEEAEVTAEVPSSPFPTSSQNPDLQPEPVQKRRPPTRGSHLTRRDKNLIEKIRSYYEAAAEEAEEEEEEPGEEEVAARRNSFSQIPSGLVKGSVSRFDVGGHQEETEATSISSPVEEKTNEPMFSIDPLGSTTAFVENEIQNQTCMDLQLQPNLLEVEEVELQGGVEGQEEKKQCVVSTEEPAEHCPPGEAPPRKFFENQTVSIGSEPKGLDSAEPEEPKITETRTESTSPKHRGMAQTALDLEGLNSQIKVGRWSRHSRIVSTNRALFEGMGSEVLGLLESDPAVLRENSERILSKVQTLARMYSNKDGAMKVPLHQKRAFGARTPSWVPSGTRTQADNTPQRQATQPQSQNPNQTWTQTRYENRALNRENQRIQEERTDDVLENVVTPRGQTSPCPHQTSEFTLSRPRDFISALTSRASLGSGTNVFVPPWIHQDQGSKDPTASRPHLRQLQGDPSWSSSASNSLQNPSRGTAQSRDQNRNTEAPAAAEGERSERGAQLPVRSLRDGPAEPRPTETRTNTEPEHRLLAESVDGGGSQGEAVLVSTGSAVPPGAPGGPPNNERISRRTPQPSVEMPPEEPAHKVIPTDLRRPFDSTSDPSRASYPRFSETPSNAPRSPDLRLPTFTSLRPPLLPAAPSNDWHTPNDYRNPQDSGSSTSGALSRRSLTLRPSRTAGLHRASPGLAPGITSSSGPAPPCSSPFRVIPASPPTKEPVESPSCWSPPPTSGRVPAVRAPPASSPTPSSSSSSSSGRSSSCRAGPPSSPTPSSCSSAPGAPSSVFTRSLAASCISQSISQSMAKHSTSLRQQAPPTKLVHPSPASHPPLPTSQLRQQSPSRQLLSGHHPPRSPASSYSTSSVAQSPSPSFSHRSPSPSSTRPAHSYSSSSSSRNTLLHPSVVSPHNNNTNNNNSNSNTNNNSNYMLAGVVAAINGAVWSGGPHKMQLANGACDAAGIHPSHDPLWSGSHNRVARPFSASEPNSRVQSPTQTPLTRLCSPLPQHDYSSPMANKPPHPRSARPSSHNPLGLTLEMPVASSAPHLSPHLLSPPAIGVSGNLWTSNVAAPQPRNPRLACTSPSSPFPTPSFPSSMDSFASAPAAPHYTPQTLRRSFSSGLADRPPSPGGPRRSWAESGRGTLGLGGSLCGEPSPTGPRSAWSPSRLCPSSPGTLPARGQHFPGAEDPDTDGTSWSTSPLTFYSPAPSDPEPEQGSCRSQLICAYVPRPCRQQNPSSSCPAPPPPTSYSHQPPQTQIPARTRPSPSPPPPSVHSSPAKPGNQRTSYATTVNLQIAGSGRITSFSTAQVSLTQTLQGGAGAGGQGQAVRRVSVNGLSHLHQNGNRL